MSLEGFLVPFSWFLKLAECEGAIVAVLEMLDVLTSAETYKELTGLIWEFDIVIEGTIVPLPREENLLKVA